MEMNPQLQQEVIKSVKIIRDGGFLFFPDETGWSAACDIGNIENVNFLTGDAGAATILLDDFSRMHKYCRDMPDAAADLAEYSTRPIEFLFKNSLNVPPSLVSDDNYTRFRIVKDEFVKSIVNRHYGAAGRPIAAKLLSDGEHPRPMEELNNKPVYIVNLRRSPKVNADSLIIVQLGPGGQIKFIQK